jgi:glycosyltransferase 2 family protein
MRIGRTEQDLQTYRGSELTAERPTGDVSGPTLGRPARFVSSSRYRHPGDVIRLIAGGLVLIVTLASVALAPSQLAGTDASAVTWPGADPAGRLLVGLVQVIFVAAAAGIVTAVLARRRFQLLIGLAAGAMVAGGALAGILKLVGGGHPHAVAVNLGHGSWLASAAFPGPALLAGAVAVTVAASPWLSRPWRRTAWIVLGAVGAARLVAGTVLPMELILALAAGITAGAGVLVALGVPDRRIGPDGIAAALRSADLPVSSVTPADVRTKGSRPFFAVTEAGGHLFIKAVGSDQRDADLLYRAYRFARLRDVGDTRPAASLIQAVEHQALAGTMAERAGVRAPRIDRVIKAADGTALLAMERVDGGSLDQLPAELISDELLRRLWAEVDRLHRAGIAHRALRAANVVVDGDGQPWLTDFSFSDLTATQRQKDIDLAELMASLATLVGADRAVSGATAVIGARGVASAAPLLQPLALSAATRQSIARHEGLLARTRSAAVAADGSPDRQLARILRVRPRTLVTIAALAGAFYFLLPQLAQVGSSWHAIQSAHWAWLPVVIAMSALTYLGSAASLLGGVPGRVPFWPTFLTQAASSFINRISPANVGGMALNARYLQKSGIDPAAGVAAVGLSALAGAVVHVILLVVFFVLASRNLAHAFKLPPASKLLLILAVVAALIGMVLATRRGRHFATNRLRKVLRSAFGSLRQVAASPAKLTLLGGGSALVTLAYFGGLAASVQAFGGGIGIAEIGAVYMAASAIAAASPTPGGLGAIEAALVAGLTGVGLSAGTAVSAVLTYRLATYWLPVAPGWIALHLLQRRDYI